MRLPLLSSKSSASSVRSLPVLFALWYSATPPELFARVLWAQLPFHSLLTSLQSSLSRCESCMSRTSQCSFACCITALRFFFCLKPLTFRVPMLSVMSCPLLAMHNVQNPMQMKFPLLVTLRHQQGCFENSQIISKMQCNAILQDILCVVSVLYIGRV